MAKPKITNLIYLTGRLAKNPRRFFTLTKILVRQGPAGIRAKVHQLLYLGSLDDQYQFWLKRHRLSPQQLLHQRKQAKTLHYRPLLSIITPTYNTPVHFLQACLASVKAQTYDNWELCIADDASIDQKTIATIKQAAKRDKRIKVIWRPKNGHISAASNDALSIAKGEFIALLDHDDILWPNALYENVAALNKNRGIDFLYSDEDKLEEDGKKHTGPFFKPDFSPDYLRSINYITHFAVIRRSLVKKVGGFRVGFEGAQDWDLFLRLIRQTTAVYHIPTVLYSWRKSPNSTASEKYAGKVKSYAYKNQQKALADDLTARDYKGTVESTKLPGTWRVHYKIKGNPKVSIIIPTKNQHKLITTCIKSIFRKTTYPNYEIILVDTGSADQPVLDFYKTLAKDKRVKIVNFHKTSFNFSATCNFGASKSKGQYLLFLNNDTEVITPDWIEGMLELAQKPETGAVGVRLLYPNGLIQHMGGILGVPGDDDGPGIAGIAFRGRDKDFLHHDRWSIKNYSFVTAACLMIVRSKFFAVKGFDEQFQIAWNDIDLCLKLYTKLHLYNVVTPFVSLIHYESMSVAKPGEKGRDLKLFEKEKQLFIKKWDTLRKNDPFFSPHLSRKSEGFDRLNY